jgi:hypothetical protein
LQHFGFDAQQASTNTEISYYTLMTRKRREILTQAEQERLADISAFRWMQRASLLLQEIKRSGVASIAANESRPAILAIGESLREFEPHVFINGRTPIHWDLHGYLHIAMRHVKEMQIGQFKGKTPFPYRADDLKTLIDKVLGQIDGVIRAHYSKPPPVGNFGRHGKMAVYFNGDYYVVKIDPNGRLLTIYVCGSSTQSAPRVSFLR